MTIMMRNPPQRYSTNSILFITVIFYNWEKVEMGNKCFGYILNVLCSNKAASVVFKQILWLRIHEEMLHFSKPFTVSWSVE